MRISDWSSDVCSSDLASDDALIDLVGCGLGPGPKRSASGSAQPAASRTGRRTDDRQQALHGRARAGEVLTQQATRQPAIGLQVVRGVGTWGTDAVGCGSPAQALAHASQLLAGFRLEPVPLPVSLPPHGV